VIVKNNEIHIPNIINMIFSGIYLSFSKISISLLYSILVYYLKQVDKFIIIINDKKDNREYR